MYSERLWLMCKTAYSILIERTAKYVDSEGRCLRVFFEESGKHEDRDLMGEPKRRTKATALLQIADLTPYPMAKGGYDPTYKPYVDLMAAGKLIDALLQPTDRPNLGIKYSCFSWKKAPKGLNPFTASAWR